MAVEEAREPASAGIEGRRDTATFGGGCFWCTEAVFQRVSGVSRVVPGYSGGTTDEPTYEDVCSGRTGHAEVVQLTFDPSVISYEKLLKVFFKTHDPTTRNRQGNDIGTQYRSVIFYHDEEQRRQAEDVKQQLEQSGLFIRPIVTEIVPFERFYPAEDYHQNYFALHPHQGYCQAVIAPKIEKFIREFKPHGE